MPILVCGLGSIGRRHLRNLQALGQEAVLLHTGKSTLPEEDLTGYPIEQDIQRALARWSPEAVIVANPTALHLDVAIPAAESGAHLLVEKPLSHSMERIDELRAALVRGGGTVLVGYQFRFHPTLQLLKRWVEDDAVGKPISLRAHWGEHLPGWHPWEDYRLSYSARRDLGGGVVLTLCHPFDYLRWIFGEVESVHAVTEISGSLDLEVEDTAEAILTFTGGTLGSVHLDYHQRPSVHRLEVIGACGTLRWDNEDGCAVRWEQDTAEWRQSPPPQGFERNDLFMAEMSHFLKVIRGEETPRCSLDDGVRTLEIALAVHRSAAEGRSVSLPTSDELAAEGDGEP
jgi:predicted dehydrogenase